MENKKSGLAVAGLVLGIIGICLSFIPIINFIALILGVLALIFSIISLIKKVQKGKAIAGLVLALATIVIVIGMYGLLSNDTKDYVDTSSASITDTSSEVETNEKEDEENKTSGIWKTSYYVDDFNQPTEEWYIVNTTKFLGEFSNSATTDSQLLADIAVDKENVSIFLYEYGKNAVKNASSNYVDNFDIVMRTPDGKEQTITGTMYCGGDRIVIDDQYKNTVINALSKGGNDGVMFRVVKSDRQVQSYLFTVLPSNFAEVYNQIK